MPMNRIRYRGSEASLRKKKVIIHGCESASFLFVTSKF